MAEEKNIIALASEDGQNILHRVTSGNSGSYYQPKLHRVFTKQAGESTCGLVSCAVVLSAASLPQNDAKARPAYTEDNMFDYEGTATVITRENLIKNGMTLDEVHHLLVALGGKNVRMVHASDCSVDQFRCDVVNALSKSDSSAAVVVNYHMDALGQGLPYGHHSPLAAYDSATDRLLILDTWRTTEECWAKVEALHKAMNTVDDESGKTRGYCVAEFSC